MALSMFSKELSIENNFFRIPKLLLQYISCWPEIDYTFWSIFKLVIHTLSLFLAYIGEFLEGIRSIGNPLLALEAICPSLSIAVTWAKLILFIIYRKELRDIVVRLRKYLFCDPSEEKRTLIAKLSNTATGYALMVFVFSSSTSLFYCLQPLVKNLFRHFSGKELTMEMPFRILVPELLLQRRVFPITYIAIGYSAYVTGFTFSGVDGFFMGFCLYTTALFRMLKYDIEQTFEPLRQCEHHMTAPDELNCRNKLKIIIQRHCCIMELCDDFTASFKTIILGHFLSAAIVICISVVMLMLNPGFGAILYVFYSCAILTQLYIYCVGATYLNESSTEIADAIYTIEWYRCDIRTQKMLYMILSRAQRGTTIKVPFFTLSLAAFLNILSTTGSYVALLKTIL